METRDYRDLTVWQRAMDLMVECYRLATHLPPFEKHEMASQLRRASISVAANIAEGNGRLHRGDYIHHVSIARGSLMEVEVLLEGARRLGFLEGDDLRQALELSNHVGRMLTRLALSLRS